MEIADFSNGFDVLLNSYGSGLVLNEHEKSVFLTKAQEEEVLSLYTGKNSFGEAIESTEELRRYLSPIMGEATLEPTNTDKKGMGSKYKFFQLPSKLWFITYEAVYVNGSDCGDNYMQGVYPVRQDEYQKLVKNPFRGANERRALRLDFEDNLVEIISPYEISEYYIRYITKLEPIILAKLDTEAAIEGETEVNNCKLHESLHQRILNRAVMLALQFRGAATPTQENQQRDR